MGSCPFFSPLLSVIFFQNFQCWEGGALVVVMPLYICCFWWFMILMVFELLNLILFGRKTWSPIVFTLKPSLEWFKWDFNDYSVSSAGKAVIISNQPYFYKKAELFPGSAFVIGADTAARLINVRNLSAIFLRWVQNFGAALSLSFFLGPSFFLSSWCFGQCHIFHFLVVLKFLSQFLN